jgi:hypothetical protein
MKDLGKKCAIDVINLKINQGMDCVPHMIHSTCVQIHKRISKPFSPLRFLRTHVDLHVNFLSMNEIIKGSKHINWNQHYYFIK